MKKEFKKTFAAIAFFILLFAAAMFVSIAKFNVANPFAVANGLYRIAFTDEQYVEIQTSPRVIVAKPTAGLKDYMAAKGFTENEEKQLGALRVFENKGVQQHVITSVNQYFARWSWQE